jgi:adenosylmethionine-8-amino-7-oxononanoate aminotransferase
MERHDIVALDRARVWHPYTAMDEFATKDPLVVTRASGSRLFDADGRSYLDGNASWYVATLGHGHPRLVARIHEQVEALAHCSMAGIAHEPGARLADALCQIAPPGLTRAFFTDDGSTAVEVAVKMAAQFWQQQVGPGAGAARKKTRFVALEGAFHGDSIGAASLGGVEVFRRPFGPLLFDCVHVPFPADNAYEHAFEALSNTIKDGHDDIAAVVVEPVVQGASGMRIYDTAFLAELRALTLRRNVLLIVDEVFAGYGRTGPMWATDHAAVTPDIMCVGKAMSPLLPMGATLTTDQVQSAFRGGKERALMYGHTLCGNPLGAALALEVLEVYRDERVLEQAVPKAAAIATAFARLGSIPGVARTRALGMIGAADLEGAGGAHGGYLGELGWRVYDEARARGAYLRPLGDTVYVTPPLNIPDEDLGLLLDIVRQSIEAALRAK